MLKLTKEEIKECEPEAGKVLFQNTLNEFAESI